MTPPNEPETSPNPQDGQPQAGENQNAGEPPKDGGTSEETSAGSSESSDVTPEPPGFGVGEEAAAATASHGDGSRRGKLYRQANRIVEGDAVARDKYVIVHGAARPVRLRQMSPTLMASAREAFVAPEKWDDVLVGFMKNRIVVLRGEVGHGRTTAALHLLRAVEAERVFHVGSAELAGLGAALPSGEPDDAIRSAGFVLDDPAEFAALEAAMLRGIEAVLESADARLVIAADAAGAMPDQAFVDLVLELAGPPDRRKLLSAHLKRRLDIDHCAAMLDRPDVATLVAEYVTDATPCSAVVRLAAALADDELSGELDISRVRKRLASHGTTEFGAWFTHLPDVETRCHAVALAVLGGVGQERIARAARSLGDRVDPRRRVVLSAATLAELKKLEDREDPFRTTQDELLGRLRARVADSSAAGSNGSSSTRAVEFRDLGYPAKVLRHVWTQFRLHDDLLAWLAELAEDPSDQVRIQAGTALGTLALLSYDHLCQSMLIPWASSSRKTQRDAVAYALRVAAADATLRSRVEGLCDGWYRNREAPLGQATAARVHGLALGTRDPGAAVDALFRLMSVDNTQVAIAVGEALGDLIVDDPGELAESVLSRLLTAADDHRLSAAAQLVFLILAVQIVTERPSSALPASADAAVEDSEDAVSQGPAMVSWPMLLSVADARPAAREAPIRLWRMVLTHGTLHANAEKVVTIWATAAQGDLELRAAFLRLARAMADRHERSRRALQRLAATWVSAENLAPLTDISSALQRVLPEDPA